MTTINIPELVQEISSRLRALDRHDAQTMRRLCREYSKRLATVEPRTLVGLASRLIDHGGIEHRGMAYGLVHSHRDALRSLKTRALVELGRGIDSWGAVDAFAVLLAGPAWREQQISTTRIRSWAGSKDRWWRRAAVVSTVALNSKARGGRGDTPRTLEICRLVVEDRDDMVVKALSWALRELAKRDPEAVREFLDEHRGTLAARVVREVTNKLTTGLKNPRRPRS
ncbi:MAG: DNA alkylation repair protein [bacterium]|nr:DNA alkylation repair protein [bacterium]